MKNITWTENYSVGVRSLDEQHKLIISMINLLIADLKATVHSESVSEVLDRLTKYSFDHFKAEERLLEKHEYPQLAEQREDHKAYRKKVVLMCMKATNGQESVPTDLVDFLRDWWIQHILESDMQYSSFLAERGVE